MQMLYNSDNFAVVQFDISSNGVGESTPDAQESSDGAVTAPAALTRGGYEIVDKFARKEIFIEGALAEHFKNGVQELIERGPTEEEFDAYLARFAAMAHQPVILH